MAYKPIDFRRLRSEDFKSTDQNLIGQIAFSYNNFGDQVTNLVNGNITVDNLQREISVVKFQVDATGTPTVPIKINLLKVRSANGISILRYSNLTAPNTPPLAAPFVTWNQNGSIITITNVLGIDSGASHQLTLEIS